MEVAVFILISGLIASLFGKKNGKQNPGDLNASQNYSAQNSRINKNNQPYGSGTQYLKRSELSYEDVEKLRREAEAHENHERIELTANTIQELRLYVAASFGIDVGKIDTLSDGRVLLDNQDCGNWRYNVFGQVEYYHPAKQLKTEETYVQPEYYEDGLDDDFSDDALPANSKGKVIRGPW